MASGQGRRLTPDERMRLVAGGVAQRFSDLLTAVVGHADLARAALGRDAAVRRHLAAIAAAARHGADLLADLLACADLGRVHPAPMDLAHMVTELAPELEGGLPSGVTLACRPSPGPLEVLGDAPALRRAVRELVANAVEAIGPGPGAITIATGTVAGPRGRAGTAAGRGRPGAFVGVTDTGPGLAAGARANLGTPFFSTRLPGRGLGLALVAGVTRGHAGRLVIRSRGGRGTSVRILLPARTSGDG